MCCSGLDQELDAGTAARDCQEDLKRATRFGCGGPVMPITPLRGMYHRQTDGAGCKLRLMATVTEQARHRMTEHWRYIYSLDCFAKRLFELLKEAEEPGDNGLNGLSESEIEWAKSWRASQRPNAPSGPLRPKAGHPVQLWA